MQGHRVNQASQGHPVGGAKMVTRAKMDLQGNGASPVSREREGRLDYQENKGCWGDQVSLGIQAETVRELEFCHFGNPSV